VERSDYSIGMSRDTNVETMLNIRLLILIKQKFIFEEFEKIHVFQHIIISITLLNCSNTFQQHIFCIPSTLYN